MSHNQQQQNNQQNSQNQPPKQPERVVPSQPVAKPVEKATVVQAQPRRMSVLVKIVGGIIIFVVVAWVLSALRTKQPESSLVIEPGSENSTSTEIISAIRPQALPVVDGNKTYTFDGISFVFEPQAADESGIASTRVRLQINNLKRNGIAVEVARYRMGTYRGTCSELSGAAVNEFAAMSSKYFLGAAQCSFGEVARQIVSFQQGDDIVTYIRTLNEDMEADQLAQISTIDVTNIVTSDR